MGKITLEDSNLEELLLLCKLNGVTVQTTKRKKLIIALKCHLKRALTNLDDYAIRCYEWPLVSALNAAAHMGGSAAKNELVNHPSASLRSVTDVGLSEMEIRREQKEVVRQAIINRIWNHTAQSKGSASAQHNYAPENAAKMRIFGTATVELNVNLRWDQELSRLHPGIRVEQRPKDNCWIISGPFDDLMKFRQEILTRISSMPNVVPHSLHRSAASNGDGNTDLCVIRLAPPHATYCLVLDKCNHEFHTSGIWRALQVPKFGMKCPLCRASWYE